MQNPLRHFSASSDYNSYEDQGYVLDEDQDYALEEDVPLFLDEDVPLLPSVKLPIVEKLPRSITWVFTKRHVCFLFRTSFKILIIYYIVITHSAYIHFFNIAVAS